tara:strand:+ start:102 stop:707 length:606 start_codon:yes stop_codon:yes gene_type:complete
MKIPSKYLEFAVEQLSSLPGIGKRTALRMALNLLNRENDQIVDFSSSILDLKNKTTNCIKCGNISDTEICLICNNSARKKDLVCVVEDIRDVMAIEATQSYDGVYHVLGGVISPMDGISPSDLNIDLLLERANTDEIKEIIFALSPTMEGDTTNYYLFKKLKSFDILLTTLSRGVTVGTELQYIDGNTLGRSLASRQEFTI